jgi:arginyl-tRNA synthetase
VCPWLVSVNAAVVVCMYGCTRQVYVKINEDADADPKVHNEGMNYFLRMERDGKRKDFINHCIGQ